MYHPARTVIYGMTKPTNLRITGCICMGVSTAGRKSCPAFTPVASSMSDCQLEPNILSFEGPYSEGVMAHRKGRDCLDCQRIWKGDKDLPVSVCLELCFSTIHYNHTHAKLLWATEPFPHHLSSFVLFYCFFIFIDCSKSRKKGW